MIFQQLVVVLVQVMVLVVSRETYCPPPVQRFLRINDKVYRRMNGAVIHMNEVAGEEVVRLRLRSNPYYSSPKCGVLETKNSNGFTHFGVREEYDLESFQKAEECEVYLARTGLGRKSVKLSVMVISDVVSGLSTECQPELSVRVTLTVKFCAAEWSCDPEEEEEEEEEEEVVEEGDYDTEYVTGCDSEWGCRPVETDTSCPGEWGCLGADTELDSPIEREFDSRTAMGVPGMEVITGRGKSDSEESQGEEDLLDIIYQNLMSDSMMPVTISCLIVLALLLLLAMWCLMCRKSPSCSCCGRSKVPDVERSMSLTSTASTLVNDPKMFSRQNSNLSRINSGRSSTRSLRSLKSLKDDDFSVYSGFPDDDKDFSHEEILVSGKRKLFTVSEEKDPTEDGLESLEWDNKTTTPESTGSTGPGKGRGKRAQRDIPVTFYL